MDNRISLAIGLTEEEVDVLIDLFQRGGSGVVPRHIDTARALFPRLRKLKFDLQDLKHPERKQAEPQPIRRAGVSVEFGNASPTNPEDPTRPD